MVPMSPFEIVFDDDAGVPQPGTTVEIEGELWEVASVDESSGTPRVHLAGRRRTDAAAHQLASVSDPVTLSPPTSFESELVSTLNDLSSRLNTLAGALNAYWGAGARGAA
jgi:hypothetical protein